VYSRDGLQGASPPFEDDVALQLSSVSIFVYVKD
jgi:hypothetical protein